MEVKSADLSTLFAATNYFSIPDYQRQYQWEDEQVSDLLENTFEAFKTHVDEHYLGSIVTRREGQIQHVLDGQQRLTTLSLLRAALCRAI